MGAVNSTPLECAGVACLDPTRGNAAQLEERCAVLEAENLRLKRLLREFEEKSSKATEEGGVRPPAMLRYGSTAFSGRQDDENTLTSAAAVVAAAEATATYQRSLVRVEVDNESDERATLVTVRAPGRQRLFGDMCGAVAGLGLTSLYAQIDGPDDGSGGGGGGGGGGGPNAASSQQVAVLKFSLLEGGRRITDPLRLRKIEQRLQQRSAGREGLAGGVKRLVVARFVRATPPWEHEVLDPAPPTPLEERRWLETLRAALGPSSASLFGAFSCANAKRLAAELVCVRHLTHTEGGLSHPPAHLPTLSLCVCCCWCWCAGTRDAEIATAA